MASFLKSAVPAAAVLGFLQGPTIRHQGLEYVSSRQFARIEVSVDLPHLVRSAKLYFRAQQYPDFYYVEMIRDEDRDTFFAILPIPVAQTAAVLYFVEVVDTAFNPSRTPIFEARVTPQRVPGSYQGGEPNIHVGSTSPHAPEIPPGFRPDGIQSIIGHDGVTRPIAKAGASAGGGGGGGGVAAAILIGAAAAGGVGYLVLKQEEEAPPPSADLSVTKTPSVRGDVEVRAPITFDLLVVNGGPDRATSVQLTDNVPFGFRITRTKLPSNALCSVSGQTIQCSAFSLDVQASFRVVYEVVGTEPQLTLTNRVEVRAAETDPNLTNNSASVTTNIVRRAPPARVADIAVDVLHLGNLEFQVDLRNLGPTGKVPDIDLEVSASGVVFDFNPKDVKSSGFTAGCPRSPLTPTGLFNCGASLSSGQRASLTFRLNRKSAGLLKVVAETLACESIDPNCANNRDSVEVPVILLREQSSRLPITFATSLESSSGSPLRGELAWNGQSLGPLVSGAPRQIPAEGHAGARNIVEAWTTSAAAGEGVWEFSFQSTEHFARGSLVVETGQVLSLSTERVVFRLSGASGERVRFRFDLER